MIKSIKTTALTAAMALGLTACGGSGSGNTAGIGGSGYISSGTITGFGSVFVNGVEFNTDSSTFDLEGTGGTQNDLAIGMVVRVNGTINGTIGNATSIIFDDELQGPVSGLSPTPILATTTSATFTVLGTTVKIDRSSTYFDGTGFSFDGIDGIANGDNVEISGFFDASGALLASRVELKEPFSVDSSIVEIKGNILNWDNGTNFTLNGIAIDASGAKFEDLPSGLSEGIRVEVKGTYNGTDTITATKVASKELHVDDSEEFEIEGLITNYDDITKKFNVNGVLVDASDPGITLVPLNLSLANDLKVEVEGSIKNNTLIPKKLKLRGGEVKISAKVTNVNTDANANANPKTIQVSPVSGQFITIELGTETELKNEILGTESLKVFFTTGNFVEIEGFENGDTVSAAQVKIVNPENPDRVKVQANIQETVDNGSIKVLGVVFQVITGTTIFKNTDGSTFSDETSFNNAARPTSNPLISVIDINSDGTADKVEIEKP